jgi:hypothetical protein
MGKHAWRKCQGKNRPKAKLGLPDLDHSKAAVLNSLRSPGIQARVSLRDRRYSDETHVFVVARGQGYLVAPVSKELTCFSSQTSRSFCHFQEPGNSSRPLTLGWTRRRRRLNLEEPTDFLGRDL